MGDRHGDLSRLPFTGRRPYPWNDSSTGIALELHARSVVGELIIAISIESGSPRLERTCYTRAPIRTIEFDERHGHHPQAKKPTGLDEPAGGRAGLSRPPRPPGARPPPKHDAFQRSCSRARQVVVPAPARPSGPRAAARRHPRARDHAGAHPRPARPPSTVASDAGGVHSARRSCRPGAGAGASLVRPPSTRSELHVDRLAHRRPPRRPRARRSPSSAARATFARVVPRASRRSPRARRASTRARPARRAQADADTAAVIDRAAGSSASAGGLSAIPSSRHIHSSIAPAANTPPSIAYSIRPSIRHATVGRRPPRRARRDSRRVPEHEHPRAVGGLHAAGAHAAAPASAACWSTTWPHSRSSAGQESCRSAPSSPAVSRTSGSTSGGTPNSSHRRSSKPGVPRVELGARRGGVVGGEARAEPVAQERVDRAHAERAGVARPLATALLVLEQPRELRGGEVRVEGQPAERLDLLLVPSPRSGRAPPASACPAIDDRRQRRAGSRHPTRAPTRPGGRARMPRPPRRPTRAARRPLPRPRRAPPQRPARPIRASDAELTLSRRASRTGWSRSSNSSGLDAGRSLVDAEQKHLCLLPHAGRLRLVSSDGSR